MTTMLTLAAVLLRFSTLLSALFSTTAALLLRSERSWRSRPLRDV